MAFVPSTLETSVTVGIDPKRYYDNDKGGLPKLFYV